MKWTPEALARLLVEADDDTIDAVIAYAEQLAADVVTTTIDSDLWRQAWTAVTRAQRLAKHLPPPPMLHHETPDANGPRLTVARSPRRAYAVLACLAG